MKIPQPLMWACTLRTVVLAFALCIVVSAPIQAQGSGTLGLSVGVGAGWGVTAGFAPALTSEISVDWRHQRLFSSVRFAAAAVPFTRDWTHEIGVLAGYTSGEGRWKTAVGAGFGLVWHFDGPRGIFPDPEDEGVLNGPYLSAPVAGEVAYQIYGPIFLRIRVIASLNMAESFAGMTFGGGVRF